MQRNATGWLNGPACKTGLHAVLVSMIAGGLMGFSMSMPYRTMRSAGADAVTDVIVVITEVRLGVDRSARLQFWDQVWTVEKALPKQPGLVGYSLRREIFGTTAWTMTLWENEDAIRAFMRSAVHRRAMQDGLPATIDTRFVRFRRPRSAGPPDWSEALDQLARSGRGYQ
jgi:heme-degrading monooxygenase HmoA